ncbi:helix-turn-helix transcriptional regulator [Luteimonas sp. A649]
MEHHTNRPSSNADCNQPTHGAARADGVATGWPDSPTLRLKDLLKVLSVSKSKAYELMKTDPEFPKGVPLYDSDRSPKFYWSHEAIAWIEGRASKFRTQQEGN